MAGLVFNSLGYVLGQNTKNERLKFTVQGGVPRH